MIVLGLRYPWQYLTCSAAQILVTSLAYSRKKAQTQQCEKLWIVFAIIRKPARLRIERSRLELWLGPQCCALGHGHFTFTGPLSTKEYKWVLVNCWDNVTMLRNNLRWISIPFRGSPYVLHAEEPRWRGWNGQCYIWLDRNLYAPINYQTTLGLLKDILWPKLGLYFKINLTFLLLDILDVVCHTVCVTLIPERTMFIRISLQPYSTVDTKSTNPILDLLFSRNWFISCQNDLISFIMWGFLFQFKLSIPCLDLFFFIPTYYWNNISKFNTILNNNTADSQY